MDLGPFAAFLVATLVGLGLSAITFLFARRSGLAPVQASLVRTLQDNAIALDARVKLLELDLDRERRQRLVLEETVERLRDTVADLAAENAALRRQLGMGERK